MAVWINTSAYSTKDDTKEARFVFHEELLMSPRYFYLDVECGASASELSVRRAVEQSCRELFGECGAAPGVCVLRAGGGRALLRVRGPLLRRTAAALALAPALRLRACAPSLQALL